MPSPVDRDLVRHRAVIAVMLGAPPAAVAADLGCDVATLMGWVRAQRQQLARNARAVQAAAPRDEAEPPAEPLPMRSKHMLGADRPVAPENSALVDAAYRRAEFDYSGRRVRPALTH
jgi:hypothetical protein